MMLAISHSPYRNSLWVFFLALVSGIWGSPVFYAHQGTGPAEPTPISVPGVSEKIHISTTIPTGRPALVPIASGPECWFCPREDKAKDENGALAFLSDGPDKLQPSAISEAITKASDDGDLVSDISKTADEPNTKVKRAPVPTETVTEMTDTFKILNKHKPWYANFQTDAGFALSMMSTEERPFTIPVIKKTVKVQWPAHYQVVTGFTKGTGIREQIEDECTGEIKVIEHQRLDWSTTVWELNFSRRSNQVYHNQEFPDITKYDNDQVKWKWLGRISDKARDDSWIEGHILKIIDDMNGEYQGVLKKGGGYREFFNNCRNFRDYLYKAIKY